MLQNFLSPNLRNVALNSNAKTIHDPNSIESLTTQLLQCNINVRELLQSCQASQMTNNEMTKKSKFEKVKNNHSKIIQDQTYLKLKIQLSKLKKICSSSFETYFKPKESPKKLTNSCIFLLVKSFCAIISLKMFLSVYMRSTEDQIEQEVNALQKIINKSKNITDQPSQELPQKLICLCIRQIFNLNSLKEYELYNVNSNQEFKYDQNTQVRFLYIISVIKLANHLKLFSYQKKKPEEIKILIKIYQEGKETFERLKKSTSSSNIPHISVNECIYRKQKQIQSYVKWIEGNWIPLLMERIDKKKTTQKEFDELPFQLFPTYQLFFIIHKLSELEFKYVKSREQVQVDQKKRAQILSKANQAKLVLQNYLLFSQKQSIQCNQMSSKRSVKSPNDNLFFIVQTTLKKLVSHVSIAQNANSRNSLETIQAILQNPSFQFILAHIHKSSQLINKNQTNTEKNLAAFQNHRQSNERVSKKSHDQGDKLYEIQIPLQSIPRDQNILQRQEKDKKEYSVYQKIENIRQPSLITKEDTLSIKTISSYLYQSNNLITPKKKTFKNPLQQSDMEETELKMSKKMISVCAKGQFLTKFNFNNNSSSLKFVKLSLKHQSILWGDTKEDVKEDPSEKKFSQVTGLVYGDVTPKIQYHCLKSKSSKPIQPWRCFSLICSSRTLDFYCSENEYDIFFWLIGLSSYLKTQHNMLVNFSRGKILWKKCFMKIRYLYGAPDTKLKDKDKKSKFYLGKSNFEAIVNFGKQLADKPK